MTHTDYCKQFIPPGGTILDVGSGRGKLLVEMAGLGFGAFGVEISPAYIKEAQERADDQGVRISVVRSSAEQIPFPEASFDFVNCSEVTEHVDNPLLVCREIFRVLKPGGSCYISFANRFGAYEFHYRLALINWLPRNLAEHILRILGKQKEDSAAIGRQKLSTMYYYRFWQAKKILEDVGLISTDIRVKKIKILTGCAFLPFLLLYLLFLRPFYFNTFHFFVQKPEA